METSLSLTDYEILAHKHGYNLADGHAYQELVPPLSSVVDNLSELWRQCESTKLAELEGRFWTAFSRLASVSGMAKIPDFVVCLTASHSIDIIGAVLAEQDLITHLIEPTFDNLALILKRRRVKIRPIDENNLFRAIADGKVSKFLSHHTGGALFLVQPNNPTGRVLDANTLEIIATHCAEHKQVLIIDNSFRFYNRKPYDDYAIISQSGTSFIAFEDTGKVWPTHEIKASLLFFSPDLHPMITAIHNEFQIGHSRFSLAILEQFILQTVSIGLFETIWRTVDERRKILRMAIENTGLAVDNTSIESQIPVEWLTTYKTGHSDVEIKDYFEDRGVHILPGRHFFWNSISSSHRHNNIRVALMKSTTDFKAGVSILSALQIGAGEHLRSK